MYTYQPIPDYKIENDRASLNIYLVSIENGGEEDSPYIYSFGIIGEIFDRTWFSVNGSILYNPNLDGGKFFFDKDVNPRFVRFKVKQISTDENLYGRINEANGTKWERVISRLFPYLHQMIRDTEFIRNSERAVMNNDAYHAQIKANRAHDDLQNAKLQLRLTEKDFIHKHNLFVRTFIGDASQLIDEKLAE